MIDELDWVKSQRPQAEPPSLEARRRARAGLDAAIEDARPRHRFVAPLLRPANLAALAAVLVVVAVVAVFLGTPARKGTAPAGQAGSQFVFQATPTGRVGAVSEDVMHRAASLLEELIAASPGVHGRVAVSAVDHRVIVHLSRQTPINRVNTLSLAAVSGRLVFFDWEANALTSSGRSVASELAKRDTTALTISQGIGALSPGGPGAGTMSLYRAVSLAAGQGERLSGVNSRPGAQYFAFGAAGSSTCGTAARYYRTRPLPMANCYLAGPAATANQLISLLPPGTDPSTVHMLAVPQGTLVLQATPGRGLAHGPSLADPAAQFYVLRDRPGLFGTSITEPAVGRDPSGIPDVTFDFTSRGEASFQALTGKVARRGAMVSRLGEMLNQHLAVALGDQLVTVPSIDFRAYPDGVPGNSGGDITGGFTRRSSQTVLLEVRLGSLPVTLRLTSLG